MVLAPAATNLPARFSHGELQPTVATVLRPGERPRVEAAGNGCFTVLHSESVADAIRVVRERPVDAVLLSVHRCAVEEVRAVEHLVREFPGVPTFALISQHDSGSSETLLHLGATGLSRVVDVTTPSGWQRLRDLVGQPATRAVARIQAPLLAALGDIPPDARLFFEVLVRLAPEVSTVRRIAAELRIRPSTLMSRFARAGLPSPKSYLAAIRLLHASHLFEQPGRSVADVAYRLEYSSPQSFGRHIRAMLGITSTEFRRRLPFPRALERFLAELVTPYRAVLRTFHPLIAGNWDSGH